MVRIGTVISIDERGESGVIRDYHTRKEFFFSREECRDQKMPPVRATVTFMRDEDFKTTPVACLVQLDQLPRVSF